MRNFTVKCYGFEPMVQKEILEVALATILCSGAVLVEGNMKNMSVNLF